MLVSRVVCPKITLLVFTLIEIVLGNGRLLNPPSRSSAWRQGFENPVNVNDDQLNCGGIHNQWAVHGGKCGVCGDPYQGPRDNEAGGLYAKGVIVGAYTPGQTINITIEILNNYRGWFEFRLCPMVFLKRQPRKVTSLCLSRFPLALADGSGVRYELSDDVTEKNITIPVRLPPRLSCRQCVLQWKWHTGNSWGIGEQGSGCIGCGPQQEFYGCSDIAIQHSSNQMQDLPSDEIITLPPSPRRRPPLPWRSSRRRCRPIGQNANNRRMYVWCEKNCARGNCPAVLCTCNGIQSLPTLG